MADQIPYSIAEQLITKLGSLALEEIKLLYRVKDDLKKFEESLSFVRSVLVDAEKKQEDSEAMKNWIRRLQDIVYDADDLFDELSTRELRWKIARDEVAQKVFLFFSSNQIWNRLKLGRRIKDIRERMNEVKNDIPMLNLVRRELPVYDPYMVIDRETSSYVQKSEIIGREKDKEMIVESLLSVGNEGNVSLVAITGFGGLGKTALAQLVYNDDRVQSHFDKKIWVCVSEEFDVKLIIKKILNNNNYNVEELRTLERLQEKLREALEGKRYLVVLDDVWNEDVSKWEKLKQYLFVGSLGSKILVTSRSKKVTSVMGVGSPHELRGLTEDQAWALFEKLAFGEGHSAKVNPNIIETGKQIAKKCKGVPLAIRTIGSLMRLKSRESEWSSVLEKELSSSFDQGEGNIMPVLKISYNHLPIHLRQIFAYCAMFPKDYEFRKGVLIRLWMAQGYILATDNNECLEDIGEQYFNELLFRSFFQSSDVEYGPAYKMHDLIHDLAQSIAKDSCIVLDEDKEKKVSERVRHLYCASPSPKIDGPVKVKGMRTLFMEFGVDPQCLHVPTSNFQRLRALRASWISFEPLLLNIGKLKYLRYLDISLDYVLKKLPTGITNLHNLQTLILRGSGTLVELPRDIKKLTSLRCLQIDERSYLRYMPIGLGELTCLHALSDFIVAWDEGPSKGAMLNELNDLNQLRGKLTLQALGYVKNVELETKNANLKQKKHLHCLSLLWEHPLGYGADISRGDSELLLENLEPHPNLKELEVDGYTGVRFSSWLPQITNLVRIDIKHCLNLHHLPPMNALPSLEILRLTGLHSLEYITDDELHEASAHSVFFPSLKELSISDCTNLKGWWRYSVELPRFPRLSQVSFVDCPRLTGPLPKRYVASHFSNESN